MQKPVYVGNLLELPLQTGGHVLVDPKTITSVSPHRNHKEQSVVRCGGDIHFVSVDYETLRYWIARK